MILLEIIVCGLVLALASGGSVRRLAAESLRGEAIILGLLPTQIAWPVVVAHLRLECTLSIIAWLIMMAALAIVLMLNSTRRAVLSLAALGISANILVIGLNQAMPVSLRAASEIGSTRTEARAALASDCLHEELDQDTALPFLADVVAVPGPTWQRGVVSLGDLLLAVGLGGWVFSVARSESNES